MALDPLQEQITQTALSLPQAHTLALAGGGAMIAHGLVDRATHDVDLFTEIDADEAVRVAAALRDTLAAAGLEITPAARPHTPTASSRTTHGPDCPAKSKSSLTAGASAPPSISGSALFSTSTTSPPTKSSPSGVEPKSETISTSLRSWTDSPRNVFSDSPRRRTLASHQRPSWMRSEPSGDSIQRTGPPQASIPTLSNALSR
ncbi:hypothetical protein GCM10009539_02740 [Cryptosporangium japonicum]|uniref:Nucleotidyl transferase AbiEii/AbiGii toxin family protein n=1 Tax=Cryptosporangium japonicum TaxID=80872 RepID=A0ABP3D4V6_9ACTN